MNQYLPKLQPYPFEKLKTLKRTVTPNEKLSHIALSIGEPKHAAPEFVKQGIAENLNLLENYPTTQGTQALRSAIAEWANRRFSLCSKSSKTENTSGLDSEKHILPVNGTREALFAFAQVVINSKETTAKVLMPNPFYQIYEGAALLAGAEPYFLNCVEENNFLPDLDTVDKQTWQDCQLFYLCTPGNPSGSTYDLNDFKKLIKLADEYDFVIASDECYSELYIDENNAPMGLLEACVSIGRNNYDRCVAFHSLSKRSNLPGLRSGFVAGDENLIARFLKYRTYHGCSMPLYTQKASISAWQDEKHVQGNRDRYREKFRRFQEILGESIDITIPPASFYIWLKTPISDTAFAQKLYAEKNITVLPGSFLARDTESGNPGEYRVRMALVASIEECEEAALRIRDFLKDIK